MTKQEEDIVVRRARPRRSSASRGGLQVAQHPEISFQNLGFQSIDSDSNSCGSATTSGEKIEHDFLLASMEEEFHSALSSSPEHALLVAESILSYARQRELIELLPRVTGMCFLASLLREVHGEGHREDHVGPSATKPFADQTVSFAGQLVNARSEGTPSPLVPIAYLVIAVASASSKDYSRAFVYSLLSRSLSQHQRIQDLNDAFESVLYFRESRYHACRRTALEVKANCGSVGLASIGEVLCSSADILLDRSIDLSDDSAFHVSHNSAVSELSAIVQLVRELNVFRSLNARPKKSRMVRMMDKVIELNRFPRLERLRFLGECSLGNFKNACEMVVSGARESLPVEIPSKEKHRARDIRHQLKNEVAAITLASGNISEYWDKLSIAKRDAQISCILNSADNIIELLKRDCTS